MTIRSEFEHLWKFKDHDGTYGIELETEVDGVEKYPTGFLTQVVDQNQVRYKFPFKGWIGHLDNSLRHYGMEYVLEKPLSFKAAIAALDTFKEATKDIPFLSRTPSTSTHVHVNMLPEEPLTMANFMTLWTMFESVLVDFSGETRKSNLFALPSRVAEANVGKMCTILKGIRSGQYRDISASPTHWKYAALNLAPLTQLGSLEIRSFRGETDIEVVKTWLRLINSILVYSRTKGLTPPEILSRYEEKELDFLDDVFGDDAQILYGVSDLRALIENNNLWYAMIIASSVPDWECLNTSLGDYVRENILASRAKPKKLTNPNPFEEVMVHDAAVTGAGTTLTPWATATAQVHPEAAMDFFATPQPMHVITDEINGTQSWGITDDLEMEDDDDE